MGAIQGAQTCLCLLDPVTRLLYFENSPTEIPQGLLFSTSQAASWVPGLRPRQCREPGSVCWDVIRVASAQTAGSSASFLPLVTVAFQPGQREATLDPVHAHIQGLST